MVGRLTEGLSDNQPLVQFVRPSPHVHVAACAKGQPITVWLGPEIMFPIGRLIREISAIQAAASPLMGHVKPRAFEVGLQGAGRCENRKRIGVGGGKE